MLLQQARLSLQVCANGNGVGIMIARIIIGVVVGGLIGFGVYRFIGCSTGTCPITSSPWLSTIFGMVIGGLAVGGR